MIRKTLTFIAIGLFIAGGCTATAPMPHPESLPQPKDTPVKGSTESRWKPQLKAGTYSYIVQDSAIISVSSDTTHVVPIQATTYLSVATIAHGDSLQIDERIDSLIRNSSSKPYRDTTPVQHHIMVSTIGQSPIPTEQPNIDCTKKIDPAITRIYELALSYPTHSIKAGDTWIDTVSTTTCHGKTLLTQQNIRRFELLEFTTWQQANSAKIQRTTKSSFSNAPTITKNYLAVTGNGTGSSTLYVDLNTGLVLQSSGETESKLLVTTSRGIFPFSQTTRTQIKQSN